MSFGWNLSLMKYKFHKSFIFIFMQIGGGGGGGVRRSCSGLAITEDWPLTTEHRQSAEALVARMRPLRPARANSAQTPARPDPPGSAGTLQSALAAIHGREVLPDS